MTEMKEFSGRAKGQPKCKTPSQQALGPTYRPGAAPERTTALCSHESKIFSLIPAQQSTKQQLGLPGEHLPASV